MKSTKRREDSRRASVSGFVGRWRRGGVRCRSPGLGIVLVGVLGSLASGCHTLEFDVRSFSRPVMVSPVLRVGDKQATELRGPSIGTVDAEASTSSASSASTYYEQRGGDVYHVSESYYGQTQSDRIYSGLVDATGGRPDVIVVVDALLARDLTHMSLFGYSALELAVQGRVFERASVQAEGGQP